MGYYINPPDMTKEEFLEKHGTETDDPRFDSETFPVCLVNNGPFTAAGIAYDAKERDAFLRPDGRPKKWYQVPREALLPYCPRLE